jgi:ankyrin repeat protein
LLSLADFARAYYHEKLAPASDVDLFIYGLDEEQAVEKIKQIETAIRDSILSETTTIRTKHAITIASQYPTRHVQIVLRLYKSVSEILTGFDVDCSCVAYDGRQVWAAPRAVAAFVTQINTVDLSRRSPSYENRLSKYSHRGFEVYWPLLERSKIDPTIFERSFSRVMGLARLLVLEKLPGPNDRDTYLAKRREERGRPALPWYRLRQNKLPGNVKDSQPDDVAEWVEEDEVSNYHTFTVPYGPRYTAKKIEKLLFTKDLLLNAEWNKPKDRETNLHRHPAFFGTVNDVIQDCCGFCPDPVTDEDLKAADKESKVFISGNISFLKDDPARQEIGSFHPITDDDWTEMAYVGNTARLCQAIVDGDLEHVEDWCKQEGADVNRRDHTGRTPLHLAAMSSTPEIVQCLIDHGARLIARLVNGFTSLHIASHRGNAAMVKAILEKSEANEEEEARKEELEKEAKRATTAADKRSQNPALEVTDLSDGGEDMEIDDLVEGTESTDSGRITEGSFVKIPAPGENLDAIDSDKKDEPDVYNVNVLAWDHPVSPLHLAIVGGHLEVIELLVSTFGADVMLPVKVLDDYYKSPRATILALVLALQLPQLEASKTTEALLALGASSAQADMNGNSALNYVVANGNTEILDILLRFDAPAAKRAVNQLTIYGWEHQASASTPLLAAIHGRQLSMVDKLLEAGAEIEIPREAFIRAFHHKFEHASQDPEAMNKVYETSVEQPIIAAAVCEVPQIVQILLDRGANVNTLTSGAYTRLHNPSQMYYADDFSLLEIVRGHLKRLKDYKGDTITTLDPPAALEQDAVYLEGLKEGTYRYWLAVHDLAQARSLHKLQTKWYQDSLVEAKIPEGTDQKLAAVAEMLGELEAVEKVLVARGSKTFKEMHPSLHIDGSRPAEPSFAEPYPYDYQRASLPEKGPYKTTLKFLVPDLTRSKIDTYHQLFEASWTGDISRVKEITLGHGGSDNRALQIAVRDSQGFSPFSIAVLRGHFELAKVVLEIAGIQYQPRNKKNRYRYAIDTEPEDDSGRWDMNSDNEGVNIVSELVDENFTSDDIGAVAETIKSKVSPMKLLTWHSEVWRMLDSSKGDVGAKNKLMPGPQTHSPGPFGWFAPTTSWRVFHELFDTESKRCRWSLIRYTIAENDMAMLRFLTEIGNSLAKTEADDEGLQVFTCSKSDYDFAVRLGRTEMIGHLIAATGAGIPLQKLVDNSGVVVQEKPKYYQGLSVHGKKRKDWAEQRRGSRWAPVEKILPPLLAVALEGNLESTEYFMGDAPLRRYKEFAAANKDDQRVKTLSLAEGGIDRVLSTWLIEGNEFAIHMAVMSEPRKDGSNPLLDFLIQRMPENIDTKTSSGVTPLQIAFELNRLYAAKTLIAAGANQATRNRVGENLIHTMLRANHSDALALRAGLHLLEQSLIPGMLVQRCARSPVGSLTPLAFWIRQRSPIENDPEIFQILLERSRGADLEIMDGAGDYPLGVLVQSKNFHITETLIKYNPALIYKENAMGMTILDIVDNAYLHERLNDPPSTEYPRHVSVMDRNAAEFQPGRQDSVPETTATRNWRIVHEAASLRPGKRQLVSLFDVNEVAKRLASQPREPNEQTHYSGGRRGATERGERDLESLDDVGRHLHWAYGFKKWDLPAFKKEFLHGKGEEKEAEEGEHEGEDLDDYDYED